MTIAVLGHPRADDIDLSPLAMAAPSSISHHAGLPLIASSARNAKRGNFASGRSSGSADPLDLPIEIDARGLLHALTHGLAQRLDVGGSRAAEIDQKVAMHLGDLGVADLEAAAAGG